jgi:putative hydrolase of the HAD superfamily
MTGSSRGTRADVVFWDFDGTLASRSGRWSGALIDALRHVDASLPLTLDEVRPHLMTGLPWHTPAHPTRPLSATDWWSRLTPTFSRVYADCGVPKDVAERAVTRVRQEFVRVSAWTVAPQALLALAHTRAAGRRNVILSNHTPELPDLVSALGLDEFVELTITSASVGAEKPHAALFLHALRVAGASRDSWMIGDDPRADIAGARAIGMRALLVGESAATEPAITLLDAARRVADSVA